MTKFQQKQQPQKKQLKKINYLLFLLLLTPNACYRMTIYSANESFETMGRDVVVDFNEHGKWNHALINGLIDLGPTNVDQLCPAGIKAVHTRTTFLNGLVGWLTDSIYTPQYVRAYCIEEESKTNQNGQN